MRFLAASARLAAGAVGLCFVQPLLADDTQNPSMPAQADEHPMHDPGTMPSHPAPDPISLAGTRLHQPGQVMFMYRYMHMNMTQLAKGDDDLSTRDVATMHNHNAGRPGQPPARGNIAGLQAQLAHGLLQRGAQHQPIGHAPRMFLRASQNIACVANQLLAGECLARKLHANIVELMGLIDHHHPGGG